MKIGDLVKVEGGKLRPPWYGEVGIIASLAPSPDVYTHGIWYEVHLTSMGRKIVRDDMLELVNRD